MSCQWSSPVGDSDLLSVEKKWRCPRVTRPSVRLRLIFDLVDTNRIWQDVSCKRFVSSETTNVSSSWIAESLLRLFALDRLLAVK